MGRPYDLTKLRKKSTGMSYGFNDPQTWIDTGCYALNYMTSNRFKGGIPLEGKITMFAGDSGCLPESAKVTVRLTRKPDNV